jgi:class 3 adenylate cyclase
MVMVFMKTVQMRRSFTSSRHFYYRWEWSLRASPEQLWAWVADTNRFNADTGLPALEENTPLGHQRRRLSFSLFGFKVIWEETPFEWVRPFRFGVVRHYLKGPLASMRVHVELTPSPRGGTRLIYQVWAYPRNLLGVLAIPLQVGLISARRFGKTFRKYDEWASQGKTVLDGERPSALKPEQRRHLRSLCRQLSALGFDPGLVERVAHLIETGDDLTLLRLRPYALADCWRVPRKALLEMFLHAVRLGLLDLRWELLCPLCQGATEVLPSLSMLSAKTHCDSCLIDFEVNFDRSVELTFRPNPRVRPVKEVAYCVGGPQVTPHIVVQQLLQPHESRIVTLSLEPGRYRVRTLKLRGGQFFRVETSGEEGASFEATLTGWSGDEPILCTHPTLYLLNRTEEEQLFIVERFGWSDKVVTAAEVFAFQTFRDLFSREALRPGERVAIGTLTIAFTDLKGSTDLYLSIGDAPAFGLVMDHFDVLRECVVAEEGAIVKTIGDAVMAVFSRPVQAVRAMAKAQHRLAHPPEGVRPLYLKAGIHSGPCIAVNLNGRLDYFGSTVNIAARLEGQSSGTDLILSEAVRFDPEVVEWLIQAQARCQPFTVTLKGFGGKIFRIWRVETETADRSPRSSSFYSAFAET